MGDGLSFWDLPDPGQKYMGRVGCGFPTGGVRVLLPSRVFHGGTHIWALIAVACGGLSDEVGFGSRILSPPLFSSQNRSGLMCMWV